MPFSRFPANIVITRVRCAQSDPKELGPTHHTFLDGRIPAPDEQILVKLLVQAAAAQLYSSYVAGTARALAVSAQLVGAVFLFYAKEIAYCVEGELTWQASKRR